METNLLPAPFNLRITPSWNAVTGPGDLINCDLTGTEGDTICLYINGGGLGGKPAVEFLRSALPYLLRGPLRGPGSISVIDFETRRVERAWPIPGGGSPDMGNVSADGKHLWLSGRFDGVVYDLDTDTGRVKSIAVGRSPHGLTIWPQPGRHSLGHTGIMR